MIALGMITTTPQVRLTMAWKPRFHAHETLERRDLLAAHLVADIGKLGVGSDPAIVGTFDNEIHIVASTGRSRFSSVATDGTKLGTRTLVDHESYVQAVATRVGSVYVKADGAGSDFGLGLWAAPSEPGLPPRRLLTVPAPVKVVPFRIDSGADTGRDVLLLIRVGDNGVLLSTDGAFDGWQVEAEIKRQVTDLTLVGDRLVILRNGRPWARPVSGGEFQSLGAPKSFQSIIPIGDRAVLLEPGGTSVWTIDAENDVTRLFDRGSTVRLSAASHSHAYLASVDTIWQTDGTEAGTRVVGSDLYATDLAVDDGGGYFAVAGETTTIWRSIGNEPARVLVDLGVSGKVEHMNWTAGRLHFAVDGVYWVSNGTQDGTFSLGAVLHPGEIQDLGGGRVLFVGSLDGANTELWISDGTRSGTSQVLELQTGTHSAQFARPKFGFEDGWKLRSEFVAFQDHIYFGAENGLYQSDGTAAGTEEFFSSSEPRSLLDPFETLARIDEIEPFNDQLFVFNSRFFPKPRRARSTIELWVTDGNQEPMMIWSANSRLDERQVPVDAFAADGNFYFRVNTAGSETELWTSDGTREGTHLIASGGADESDFAIQESHVVYWEPDSLVALDRNSNEKTVLAMDEPVDLYTIRNQVVYVDQSSGIWATDGTSAPQQYFELPGEVDDALVVDDLLYFVVNAEGDEIWRTDGTVDGTFKVQNGRRIHDVDGQLYIWKQERGVNTLHTSDGTSAGMRLVVEIPGSTHISFCCRGATPLVRAGDSLFFVASSKQHGGEIWRIDEGSGTLVAIDTNPGRASSLPQQLISLGSDLLYIASNSLLGRELWRYTPDEERTADFDGNGLVNFADFQILSANFGAQENATRDDGDADGDGDVDFADFLYLSSRFS